MGFLLMYSIIVCTNHNSALTTTCVGVLKVWRHHIIVQWLIFHDGNVDVVVAYTTGSQIWSLLTTYVDHTDFVNWLSIASLKCYSLSWMVSQGSYGQGKLEKVREFEWSGKGQGKIFFLEKSGKMKNWCHQMSDFQAKVHQIRFPLGLHPTPRWGSLQCSPRPTSCTYCSIKMTSFTVIINLRI